MKGEIAKITNFVGAIAVGDLVKTTMGPKGMDKILKPMSNLFQLSLIWSYQVLDEMEKLVLFMVIWKSCICSTVQQNR